MPSWWFQSVFQIFSGQNFLSCLLNFWLLRKSSGRISYLFLQLVFDPHRLYDSTHSYVPPAAELNHELRYCYKCLWKHDIGPFPTYSRYDPRTLLRCFPLAAYRSTYYACSRLFVHTRPHIHSVFIYLVVYGNQRSTIKWVFLSTLDF